MLTDALLAYLHFVAIIGTVSFLVAQALLCRTGMDAPVLHRLKQVDIAYASFAVLALVTGLLRLFLGAKGSAFYTANPVFHAKLGVYVAVGLLSIRPTQRFVQWSKAACAHAGQVPADAEVLGVRRLIMMELMLVATLPLAATLMARGLTGLGT